MSARRESLAGVISTIASSCVRWETALTHNTKLKSGVCVVPLRKDSMSAVPLVLKLTTQRTSHPQT